MKSTERNCKDLIEVDCLWNWLPYDLNKAVS